MTDTRLVQACLDVETTGLTPGYHEIIEIGLTPRQTGRVKPFLMRMIADFPDRMEPGAFNAHKLDPTEGYSKTSVFSHLQDWVRLLCLDTGLSKVRLIGHQVGSFDVVFAKSTWGVETWNRMFSYRHRDTASVAMILIDAGIITPASPKLAHLLEYFGIDLPNPAHRAGPDSAAELELWLKMEELLKQHPGALTA